MREHTVSSLQQRRCAGTACKDGPSALNRMDEGCFQDLLLTDVRLPCGTSGGEFAENTQLCCAGIKVLYVSGYTENAFLHDVRIEQDACLFGRPFHIEDLAQKLHEVIGP